MKETLDHPLDIAKWLDSYEKHLFYERGSSLLTIRAYRQDIGHFLNYINQKIRQKEINSLDNLNLEILYSYINSLTFFQKKKLIKVKDSTKARRIVAIKLFLIFYAQQVEQEFPFLNQIIIKKKDAFFPHLVDIEKVKEALTKYELSNKLNWEGAGENYFKKKKLYRNFLIYHFLYGLGARVSEVSNLTLEQVKESEGFITLHGKGDKIRQVPTHIKLTKQIEVYLSYVRLGFIHPKKSANNFFFLNSRGEKLSRISIWKIIKSFTKKAGWGDSFSPHSFRHMYATHLLRQGAELRTLQQLLGHESITTTEKYTHLVNKDLEETFIKYHPFYE